MTELIEPIKVGASGSQQTEYFIYYIFGALETILAFRLVFKLAGASLNSGFVRTIYSVTNIFIWPFEGIFRRGVMPGAETTLVLEPSTLLAIAAYAIVAWGIVKFVRISSGEQQPEV